MKTTAIRGKPGIRIKENGKFIVTRYAGGDRTTREFSTLREAELWKKLGDDIGQLVNGKDPTTSSKSGGTKIYFRDVYEQYLKEGMVELTESTVYKKKQRMINFFPGLFPIEMSEMDGRVILHHIQKSTKDVLPCSKRCNFDKELKDLSSILSWYNQEVTPFPNPIRRKHYKAGVIRAVEKRKKDFPPESLPLVLMHTRKEINRLAVMQFLLGARIGEAAAINDRTVDFRAGIIDLSETIVWIKGAPQHVRATKTGVVNRKTMTPLMREILLEMKNERPPGCTYFFHHKGRPFRHAMILKEINEALIKANFKEYSGTHILRHSMATFTRKESGLDIAQAMLGHTSARQTEGYAKLDVNEGVTSTVIRAEKRFFPNGATKSQPQRNQDDAAVI